MQRAQILSKRVTAHLGHAVSAATRAKLSAAFRGKKLSEAHLVAIRQAQSRRKGVPRSAEVCARISAGHQKRLVGYENQSKSPWRATRWAKQVKERDVYTCLRCGEKGTSRTLRAHHVKPWKQFPALRFELSNGRTLCPPCHAIEERECLCSR